VYHVFIRFAQVRKYLKVLSVDLGAEPNEKVIKHRVELILAR
jgi:hypothetical protein